MAAEQNAASDAPDRTEVLRQGVVTSDKMDKTRTIRLDRLVKHAKYGKYIRRNTTVKAHDERNESKAGDLVEVAFARPLSKTKRWRLVRILQKGAVAELASGPVVGGVDA